MMYMAMFIRLAICMLVAASVPLPGKSKPSVEWKRPSEALFAAAAEQSRPIIVDIWASWCEPCRRMDSDVWNDPQVIAVSQKFVAVRVDVTDHPDLDITGQAIFGAHSAYTIKQIPTLIVFDPWREPLITFEQYVYLKDLVATLQEVPADYSAVKKWREALDSDRKNARALTKVGEFYQLSKAFALSNRYYREALNTPGAREDALLREDLQFGVAMNDIRTGDWRGARKSLELFQTSFPQSPRQDQVLLGLILADVRQKKHSAAQKRFEELKARFPNSTAIASAESLLKKR